MAKPDKRSPMGKAWEDRLEAAIDASEGRSPKPSTASVDDGGDLKSAINALTAAIKKMTPSAGGSSPAARGPIGRARLAFAKAARGIKGKGRAARLARGVFGFLGASNKSLMKNKAVSKIAGLAGKVRGGPAGMAVMAVVELGRAAVDAYKRLDAWTEGLQKHNTKLAEFSASMAAVMAIRDIQDVMRSRDRGEAVAGSAQILTDAESYRKDQTQEILILADRLENTAGAVLNLLVAEVVRPLNELARIANEFIGREESKSLDLGELLDRMDKSKEYEKRLRASAGG
jgi:hypothetical protein